MAASPAPVGLLVGFGESGVIYRLRFWSHQVDGVARLLDQGDLSYRAIHDLTGVSVTTVGRVARFLTDGFGGYKTALNSLKNDNGAGKSHPSH